ncbi:hypothetical protein [Actinomadura sp. 3N407]|uniref:hypothetical protein n=1 Tax=Actinomadura sp. 3N407 TaxID=3457423 RepID=UPI003FCCC74E
MSVKPEALHCPDCGTATGQPHASSCDVARCLWTGLQRLSCKWFGLDPLLTEHDCGQDAWSGRWPGEEDAERLDWWIYWDGPSPKHGWDYQGRGWVRVTADHPDAMPDLNRLVIEGRWDRKNQRWVARGRFGSTYPVRGSRP